MNRIVSAGVGVAVLVLALTALFTPHDVTPTHSFAPSMPAPPRESIAPPDPALSNDASEDMDAIIDLYGNDVTPAVATYSLDALGSLYEEHSPQTELPRLGSPKT